MRSFPDTVIEPCSLGSSSYKFISTRWVSFSTSGTTCQTSLYKTFRHLLFSSHTKGMTSTICRRQLPPFACFIFPRLATAPYSFGYGFLFSRALTTVACFPLLVTVPCIFDNVCLFSRALATVACFSEFWLQLPFSPAPWQGLLVFPRSNIIFLFKFPFAVVVNRSISTFI